MKTYMKLDISERRTLEIEQTELGKKYLSYAGTSDLTNAEVYRLSLTEKYIIIRSENTVAVLFHSLDDVTLVTESPTLAPSLVLAQAELNIHIHARVTGATTL